MAKVPTILKICGIVVLVTVLSSFTFVRAEDSSKSEEHSAEKDVSTSDDSHSEGDSKEKRSREEILFGNQQNKPSGLVDDLMSMSEDEPVEDEKKKSNIPEGEGQNAESFTEDSDEKRPAFSEDDSNNMMTPASGNWYNSMPVSSAALEYFSRTPTLQGLNSQNFANSLYDQEDVYRRRRRQLPLPLRRRRSLRSSLGQMIQQRGLRMPRRSMRLKRQVDLYSLLNSDAFYNDQGQVSRPNFEGWENRMDKRHVPGHFSSYPQTPAPEYRYPYRFNNQDDNLEFDGDQDENGDQGLTLEDIDNLMLIHPNARYVEGSDVALFPYRTPDDEKEAFQNWLSHYTTPSTFKVSRRSNPTFYPLDYRYIPGYKKRSIFSHGNRMNQHHFSGDTEEVEPDLGMWGNVVQVPEAYASPEDVARLYGLASLMAEGDEEAKAKRAA